MVSSSSMGSVRIMDVDLVGVAVLEAEEDAPRAVDVDGPVASEIAFQLVQPDRVESAEVIERCCGVELHEALAGEAFIETGKLGLASLDKASGRRALDALDHTRMV